MSLTSNFRASMTSMTSMTSRVVVVSTLSFAMAVSFLAAFALWAMLSVDHLALSRQAYFATSGVDQILDRIPKEQESITIWDDAVLFSRAGDQQWMEENIGKWVGDYFDHDEVYILNAADQPVHAMKDGRTIDPSLYAERHSYTLRLVADLRLAMKQATSAQDDSAAAVMSLGTQNLAVVDGLPAGISVKPIVPSSTRVASPPGSEFLHISIRRVDADVLAEVAEKYRLEDLHLAPAGRQNVSGEATAELVDSNGRSIGLLEWKGDRPGLSLLLAAAPGLIGGVGIGGFLLAFLLSRLRKSSAQLQASEAQTKFLAFHDTLTGLPNRALFEDRLDRALALVRTTGTQVALHSLDIDRFKNVNDTRGHPAGDELIRIIAARLSPELGPGDTVARLGGDEFAIIQVDVGSSDKALAFAARMLAVVRQPCEVFGRELHVTASMGLIVTAGRDTNREELLRKADIALYEAKARGRACVVQFRDTMDDAVTQRRIVEEELRLALELGSQIKVLYQPVFGQDASTVLGAEALVRWDHPVHGRMSPDLFIGIAEESELMEQLGDFVLFEAAKFAVSSGLPWVAVNASPVQFRNEHFAVNVLRLLAAAGLSPNRFQIEITEGVLLENASLVQKILAQLRSAGVRVALDDFGTGYSSMSYLRRYQIDKLKIDKSFVAELGSSPESDAIIRAMISLARSLRLHVTAEGVETQDQCDHLVALGCHELQGFLLSRPISAEQLQVTLRTAESPEILLRA